MGKESLQVVLEELDIHRQKNEVGSLHYIQKINSKEKNYKTLGGKQKCKSSRSWIRQWFLKCDTKKRKQQKKDIDKLNFMEI